MVPATPVEVTTGTTLMVAAVLNRVPGILARCGGAGGCATCQVYVDEAWRERSGSPSRKELHTLRFAYQPNSSSRLACQIVMTEALDGIELRLPPRQF